jgi:hypothetical protein
MLIVRVLEPAVMRERRDMRQMDAIAGVHEPVHQPVPIIGGLDGDTCERLPERREGRQDPGQLVAQSLLIHHVIVLVEHHDHTVGPMQIDAGIVLHHRTLLSVRCGHQAQTP